MSRHIVSKRRVSAILVLLAVAGIVSIAAQALRVAHAESNKTHCQVITDYVGARLEDAVAERFARAVAEAKSRGYRIEGVGFTPPRAGDSRPWPQAWALLCK